MSTSGSMPGSSTPSTHPSDDEWEEITNTATLSGSDLRKSFSTESGSSEEPSDTTIAKLFALQNVFRCLAQHVDWAKNQKQVSRKVLLKAIGKALYEHDFNPTDIVDYIGKTPRSLPTGKELIKLRELHHARDNNGNQYGEKRQASNLCEEVMNLCVDVYLDVDPSLKTWKEETRDIVDFPVATTQTPTYSSDDEWEKITNESTIPGVDVMKSSPAESGSSEEPSDSDIAKLSAMQNVFLSLKVHVDPLFQKPLSRKMTLEYISVALYDNDLNPSEIIDYIDRTPRTLPRGEDLIKLRQFNQSRDSNGIQYGEKRPAALNLCEEVMNLCIDVYLDEVLQDTWKEETKRIEDVPFATTHTTATSAKLKEKETETKFNSMEEFMKHAAPSVTFTSYHPAKLETCVPPLNKTKASNPMLPKVITPSTVPGTASADTGTTQNLLVMAKEVRTEANLINKLLNKSANTASLLKPMGKSPLPNNIVSHAQLPSTHPIFKDENRPLFTQFKQGKRTLENSQIPSPSCTSGGLDDEQMKPLYARSGAKEASLWKADMIYATHGLPTQKSFTQQLSDQLDNPPYVDRGSNAALWRKKNMTTALSAHELKPGEIFEDGKLVSYGVNINCDITEAALGLSEVPPGQKSGRLMGVLKNGMAGGKTVSIEPEKRRITEIAKAHVERQAADALAASISTQRCEKPLLPAVNAHHLRPTNIRKNGKVAVSLNQKGFADIQKSMKEFLEKNQAEQALTPTQKFEKTLTDHARNKIPSSMFFAAGYLNSRLTAYSERIKNASVSEAVAKNNDALKPTKYTDRISAVKEFKEGPVTSPTKEEFEQEQLVPSKKELVIPTKKKAKCAAWTESSDDGEPPHWVKVAGVPVVIFLLCTFVQIMMNLGTINSTICSVVTPCLELLMDCTSCFWSGAWWMIKSLFLLFGYVGVLSGGLVNEGIAFRPEHAHAPPNALPITVEPGAPIIPAMAETITLWEAMGKEKAKHPQCENSPQISSEKSAESSTGIRYKSIHSIGNGEWMMYSDHPFTRHNNSIPEADRCEHFVKSFQHFWKEEMEEKKENEGKEGRFDLKFGNELAEVLNKYCK